MGNVVKLNADAILYFIPGAFNDQDLGGIRDVVTRVDTKRLCT